MAVEILRDLRGLRVEVIHAPDPERAALLEHLHRIGCLATCVWPPPATPPRQCDLVIVAIEHDSGLVLRRLFGGTGRVQPTVIGIVGYENPSTLQLVLEIGAQAVIERPIRPFGLLTQLVVARSLWLRQQDERQRSEKLRGKLIGLRQVQRALLILMTDQRLTEEAAYHVIRRRAMADRTTTEAVADAIIKTRGAMQSA